MLSIEKLEVVYHHISTAVQGISLTVLEGSIIALIGVNGAGKTTVLRAVSGFLGIDNAEITDGEILFQGEKINGLPPNKIARKGIILVPERDKIFENLSTYENLAIVNRQKTNLVEKVFTYFPCLKERKNSIAGFLSGGERQMLSIGAALLCSPKLLLIDELSQGLAPLAVNSLRESLLQMKRDMGLTIMIVEQNASFALDIADYAAVMENGRIVLDGPPKKLLAHDDVREFYLGINGNQEKTYRDVKQYQRSRRWWG